MGVRGFTTYMSHHSHLFLKSYQLKNCYLVLDGSGIAINMYQWHTRANDCFGGDYDNYANTVSNFFNLLAKCNVTPIILFDGGYEDRKLKTVFSRLRNRLGATKRLNPVTQGSICVFPLFVKELFQDIAIEMGVKCIRNDYESDSEIACLARNLKCPILGYDSDFYFFDTLYIPFNTFEMKVFNSFNKESGKNENYIPCQVYHVDNFLNYFGNINKEVLPLLAVLLGNDYVKKSFFSAFHRHMKLKKSKAHNEQQKIIKVVIQWLRHETLQSAIAKILGRFKARRRRLILYKLNKAMQGYLQVNSSLTGYLDEAEQSFISKGNEKEFDILKIEPIEPIEEDLVQSSEESEDSSEESEDNNEELEVTEDIDNPIDVIKIDNISGENTCFIEKYRRCQIPQCFVDIKFRGAYFCLSQIENFSDPHSHFISLKILACLHKILTQSNSKGLVCIARGGGQIRKKVLPICDMKVPSFSEIQRLNRNECKKWFFKILDIEDNFQQFLEIFPSSWHIFLISLKYWKMKSQNNIDSSFISSLIACALLLNIVDPQIGYCRSMKTFFNKYNENIAKQIDKIDTSSESLKSCFENITRIESLKCLEIFLPYFHMEPKMSSNIRLFDVTVVSQFSQFQSCLFHIKFLNSIFNFPFQNILISKFYTGTLLYNLTINFRKRNNLKMYIENLLRVCPNVLCSFQTIIERFEQNLGEFSDSSAKKVRKRRRKQKPNQTEEVMQVCEDEELFIDEENKYTMLQNVNVAI